MHQGRLLQLGAPVDLLTHPVDDMVARLVGSDNILRELQYLTASAATDVAYASRFADGERLPSCPPDDSLLAAMLRLFDTRAPALVLESDGKPPVRYITLASIIATLTKGRSRESELESEAATGRAIGRP